MLKLSAASVNLCTQDEANLKFADTYGHEIQSLLLLCSKLEVCFWLCCGIKGQLEGNFLAGSNISQFKYGSLSFFLLWCYFISYYCTSWRSWITWLPPFDQAKDAKTPSLSLCLYVSVLPNIVAFSAHLPEHDRGQQSPLRFPLSVYAAPIFSSPMSTQPRIINPFLLRCCCCTCFNSLRSQQQGVL